MTEQFKKRFFNVQEVAEYLSLKVPTIRTWVRLGKIPFFKIGRAVRFDLREIDKWADKKKVRSIENFLGKDS